MLRFIFCDDMPQVIFNYFSDKPYAKNMFLPKKNFWWNCTIAAYCVESLLISKLPGYYPIHACSVSYAGNGVVFSGNTNAGKTTLCVALLREGYKFLSDECALVNLETKNISPFPLKLSLRRGAFNIIDGVVDFTKYDLSNIKRIFLDAEDIVEDSLGDSSEIRFYFLIENRYDPDFVYSEREITDFVRGSQEEIWIKDKLLELLNIFQKNTIWSAEDEIRRRSRIYCGKATIKPLKKSEAFRSILQQPIIIPQNYSGVKILEGVSKFLSNVQCYKLTVGDSINECVETVTEIVSSN